MLVTKSFTARGWGQSVLSSRAMRSLGKLEHGGRVSRDGTVTSHNEVTPKSETGLFDEHMQKQYRHGIYDN